MHPHREPKFLRGARKLVFTCLGLLPGQELLIFADETTLDAAGYFHRAATEGQVHATIIFIPTEDQVRLAHDKEFPLVVQAAMRDAQAILTCVSDQPEATNFRVAIIRAAKSFETKIGNCPGFSTEMLSTAVDVDYAAMASRCNLLAVVLAKGKALEITTWDRYGGAYLLEMKLGGWERIPVTSNGVISEGVWGNIPSGETYVAPLESTVEGEIVINGSVPGYVFAGGCEIKLTFHGGELAGIDPEEDPGGRHLQAKLDAARVTGDSDCHRLAEVGVGVNLRVKELTGKPLIDEKKAGTAHIALGNNHDFGGSLCSSLHLDLITRAPTIRVNGIVILDRGRVVIRESDWRESYRDVEIPPDWPDAIEGVSRSGNKINQRSPRLLQRELLDGAGRVLRLPVGDNPTAKLAATVYSRLPPRGAIPLDELWESTDLSQDELLRVLKVLRDYELVRLHNEPPWHMLPRQGA